MFDFKKLAHSSKNIKAQSYERRIDHLVSRGVEVDHIKAAVRGAIENLNKGKRSFVIYGEPQSGKTEMMIALTAKLLDEEFNYIVVLMNDSLPLLAQNLDRFRKAGLNTIPVNYKELLDKSVNIESQSRVIFSKKNASDLKKLVELTRRIRDVVVIDDEADYATPNSKINKNEVSRINELTGKLIENGIYIGVTATPARLDLNNTHLNEPESWVDFPVHSTYTGQDIFFPTDIEETSKFILTLLPDENDSPTYMKNSIFNFLIGSSYLNMNREADNYTMLIHTSGKKNDHAKDFEDASKLLSSLSDNSTKTREKLYRELWDRAENRYPGQGDRIVTFIMAHIESHYLTVMNSDHDADSTVTSNPPSPFTIIIGGNSISRGVTFHNLISMFFTRDAKHNLQQDTYIQRARMFGGRGKTLDFFELAIPRQLYADWRRAFIFHRLSLESRKNGNGIPVWHEGMRIKVAATSSIDASRVTFDRGEMSFTKFVFSDDINDILESDARDFAKLQMLKTRLPEDSLPQYLIDFIHSFSGEDEQAIVVHPPRSIMGMDAKYTDYDDISRSKGLAAGKYLIDDNKPEASHHIFIYFNDRSEARLIYKFNENISFIKGSK